MLAFERINDQNNKSHIMLIFFQGKSKTDWRHNLTRSNNIIYFPKKSDSGPLSTDQSEFPVAGAMGDFERVSYRRACSSYISIYHLSPLALQAGSSPDSKRTANILISK